MINILLIIIYLFFFIFIKKISPAGCTSISHIADEILDLKLDRLNLILKTNILLIFPGSIINEIWFKFQKKWFHILIKK